ncbi:MAG TPA: hypothetical protein VG892_03025 [Terriglobales bacterium]|jgi:hypothetical protein|nr:hypothetical protein [Terriglobales bacterium]
MSTVKFPEAPLESPEAKPFIVESNQGNEKHQRSAAEIQVMIERRNLELAKAKVTRELGSVQSPRYAEMLNHALRELNEKLAKFN